MKCIKLVSELKGSKLEIGRIERVSDIVAHQKVLSGNYNYVSKSEWKKDRKGEIVSPNTTENVTSEKKVKKSKVSDVTKETKKGKSSKKVEKQ